MRRFFDSDGVDGVGIALQGLSPEPTESALPARNLDALVEPGENESVESEVPASSCVHIPVEDVDTVLVQRPELVEETDTVLVQRPELVEADVSMDRDSARRVNEKHTDGETSSPSMKETTREESSSRSYRRVGMGLGLVVGSLLCFGAVTVIVVFLDRDASQRRGFESDVSMEKSPSRPLSLSSAAGSMAALRASAARQVGPSETGAAEPAPIVDDKVIPQPPDKPDPAQIDDEPPVKTSSSKDVVSMGEEIPSDDVEPAGKVADRPAHERSGGPGQWMMRFPGRFDKNQYCYATLNSKALARIERRIEVCRGDVYVYGHSSPVGDADIKKKVSRERAECVRRRLMRNPALQGRDIFAVGVSDTVPLADTSRVSKRRNAVRRRVTIECR